MNFPAPRPHLIEVYAGQADLIRLTSPEQALAAVRVVWQKSGSLWVPTVQAAPAPLPRIISIHTKEAR